MNLRGKMNKICVYPGSFDPITLGHLDIIKRAAALFDTVSVCILINNKKKCMFSLDERLNMIKEACKDIPNAKVSSYDGLLVDYAKSINAKAIIRGLRAISDFEAELQMANINKQLCPEIETFFMATNPGLSFVSSSAVREIAEFGGDFSKFVPSSLVKYIQNKYKEIDYGKQK